MKFSFSVCCFFGLLLNPVWSTAPDAFTVIANRVSFSEVQLNALVNPNAKSTKVSFEFGLSTAYGQTASLSNAISGSNRQWVKLGISSLMPGKIYHYRVKATNSDGTSYGSDRIFITGSNFSSPGLGNFSLFVDEKGCVIAVGNNSYGELGDSTTLSKSNSFKVLKGEYKGTKYLGDNPQNPVIAVSSGMDHSLALTADGSVYAWGINSAGQLGNNSQTDRWLPTRVLKGNYNGTKYLGDNSNNPVIAIDAGGSHNLVLCADGTVFSFGEGIWAQLGDNNKTNQLTPVQVKAGDYVGTWLGDDSKNPIVAISAGGFSNAVLAADGTVYTWGFNAFGQCGDSTNIERIAPVKVLKGEYSGSKYLGDQMKNPIVAIFAGCFHVTVLSAEGRVYSFGYNVQGQLGNNSTNKKEVPVQMLMGDYNGSKYLGDAKNNPVIAISGGLYHVLTLTNNGNVFALGYNNYGNLGDSTTANRSIPTQVLKGSYPGTRRLGDDNTYPIIALGAGQHHSLVMATDGIVYSVGYNSDGQLGDNSSISRVIPTNPLGLGSFGVLDLIYSIPRGFLGNDVFACGLDQVKISSQLKFSSYKWNTGATSNNITVKSTGYYILWGNLINGEVASDTLLVSIIHGKISPRDTLVCDNSSLQLKAKEAGTTNSNQIFPLKYQWSTGDTTKTILYSSKGKNKIRITVKNAFHSCLDSTTTNISKAFFTLPQDTIEMAACNRDSLRLSVGKPWKSVYWSTGITDSVVYLKKTGTYTVRVRDSLGCYAKDTFYFYNPGKAFIQIDSVVHARCYGENSGELFSSAMGGFLPYQFSWSDPKHQVGSHAIKLLPGSYVAFVKDRYGCIDSIKQDIGSPSALIMNEMVNDSILCYGGQNGSITMQLTGGVGPYKYLWDDPKSQTTAKAQDLPPGTYHVIGEDANGCRDSMLVKMHAPSKFLKALLSDSIVCNNQWVFFKVMGVKQYQWYDEKKQKLPISNGIPYLVSTSQSHPKFWLIGENRIGCVDSLELQLEVLEKPQIDSLFGPRNNLATNFKYQYQTTSSVGMQYRWDIHNGFISNGQGTSAVEVEWTKDGLGWISLEVVNSVGCRDTIMVNTTVGGVATHQPKNANAIQFFPNPTQGLVYFSNKNAFVSKEIKVYQPASNQWYFYTLKPHEKQLDLSRCSDGIYWIYVDGTVYRLVKMSH